MGTLIGGFRLVEVIGRGGMGTVYRAEDTRMYDREVAVKILKAEFADDEDIRSRFLREAQEASRLGHPNIIPIFSGGEDEGVQFIAMQYVNGRSLRTIIDAERQMSVERACWLLDQVAAALDAAHAQGIVHRDVKPENILALPTSGRSNTEHVYLSDFGLTKRLDSKTQHTRSGMFVGTPDYAAPEQVSGKDVDGRTDVYSLACVFHECLTGAVPFQRDSDIGVLMAHLSEPPPAVTLLRPDLPLQIDDAVFHGMAKAKEQRPASAAAFMAEVRAASVGQPRNAIAPPPPAPVPLSPLPGAVSPLPPQPSPLPDALSPAPGTFSPPPGESDLPTAPMPPVAPGPFAPAAAAYTAPAARTVHGGGTGPWEPPGVRPKPRAGGTSSRVGVLPAVLAGVGALLVPIGIRLAKPQVVYTEPVYAALCILGAIVAVGALAWSDPDRRRVLAGIAFAAGFETALAAARGLIDHTQESAAVPLWVFAVVAFGAAGVLLLRAAGGQASAKDRRWSALVVMLAGVAVAVGGILVLTVKPKQLFLHTDLPKVLLIGALVVLLILLPRGPSRFPMLLGAVAGLAFLRFAVLLPAIVLPREVLGTRAWLSLAILPLVAATLVVTGALLQYRPRWRNPMQLVAALLGSAAIGLAVFGLISAGTAEAKLGFLDPVAGSPAGEVLSIGTTALQVAAGAALLIAAFVPRLAKRLLLVTGAVFVVLAVLTLLDRTFLNVPLLQHHETIPITYGIVFGLVGAACLVGVALERRTRPRGPQGTVIVTPPPAAA